MHRLILGQILKMNPMPISGTVPHFWHSVPQKSCPASQKSDLCFLNSVRLLNSVGVTSPCSSILELSPGKHPKIILFPFVRKNISVLLVSNAENQLFPFSSISSFPVIYGGRVIPDCPTPSQLEVKVSYFLSLILSDHIVSAYKPPVASYYMWD